MDVMTISADRDHESTQIELLDHSTDHDTSSTQRRTRNLWRHVLVVFRAHARLYSIIQNGGNTLITTDPGVNPDESSSYTVLPSHNDDAGDDEASAQNSATDHLDIRLDIHNSSSSNNNDSSNNNNSINVETLSSVVKEKNLDFLSEHGGVEGIAAALDTNLENGISSEAEDVHSRQDAYGTNTYGEALTSSKSFFYFFFKAAIDWTNLLLFCCAALSLGSGIKEEGLKNGWYDGTIIFISIIVLISATTIKNYCLSRNSKKLRNENSLVIQVLRQGQPQSISIFDVVVGDIVFLKIGDLVPADGLFVKGENLKVDDDVLHDSRIDRVENPFLYCGAKVVEGSAHMLVTSVGRNTAWGEMMSTVNHDTSKHTLIQVRLDKLNTYLQNIGLFLAILILVVLLLRYLMGKTDEESGYPDQISKRTAVGELMKAVERFLTNPRGFRASLTTVLAILLVGIQEGLPLIITISLSYWNGRMVKLHQIIIRELCGCVTMGSITTICTNKTAELTLDLEEVMFWVGEEEVMFWVGEEAIGRDNVSIISQDVLEAICNGVATPGLVCDTSTSPTKDPLLRWAVSNLGMDMEQLKKNRTILIRETFSSDRKKSGFLMRKNGNAEKAIHLHWRGSADTILAMCSDYYKSNGDFKTMDEGKRGVFQKVIEKMTAKGLQSIAFAHRLIEDDCDTEDDVRKLHEDGLILLGLLGIKYSCYPEARSAVDAFLHAGISIKLVSPESLLVLISIAIQYGILQSGQDLNSLVLEGEEFRKLSEAERLEKVDQITVMGSSLPSDKLLFIQCLRQRGQVVAVTGVTASDSPALKEADVGLLMGTQNSEMAKESSDIVIASGHLASMVTVLLFGRCAYKNIQKFIQLELTINISGLLITFVTTVSLGEAPITPLQLLLVNLMVGTLAALALWTGSPTKETLKMPPVNQTESLITKAMWRNIFIQVCYQAVVLLMFQFKGQILPGMNRKLKKSMILNGFILCQVFNQFNARESEKKNVFKGILNNHWFLVAVGAPIVLQVVVVEFATSLSCTERLNWLQWLACILFAIMSWPIDYVVKCISGFFTNRSIGSSWLCFTSPIPSTPLTSDVHIRLVV